jgi:1-phosphatidylinositol-4-phosphate 5-kinase
VAELSVFSPNTFEHLRNSVFGISEGEYRKSIFGSGPFVSFQSNSKGAARVGGVFFFTRDGAYMIKTIKKEEAKTFLKMLPKYHKHMKRYARTSLLTRFCGMYGVRIADEGSLDRGTLHTFVVMNSAFPAEASRFISERFDLKGSTVGREVSDEELKKKGRDAVMKDLDLAREVDLIKSISKNGERKAANYGFNIGPLAKSALLSQLRNDVKLLVDCQVMDYSLLVGVVDMETFLPFDRSARRVIQSVQKVGRRFSTSKRMEDRALWAVGAPIRLLSAPLGFVANEGWSLAQRILSSIVTLPLPYYGAGECGVDGGLLSVFHGTRNGKRALYYMGLIDFLQPWTSRKVVERQLKGLMGQDINGISCVTPEEYAHRFLEFLDAHLS